MLVLEFNCARELSHCLGPRQKRQNQYLCRIRRFSDVISSIVLEGISYADIRPQNLD
jgi:hypothetical protein